jgi:hypothetical protein
MASDTNAIITKGELISHYSDKKYWKDGLLPASKSDTQAATAAWITSNLNSPTYVWNYVNSYPETKCVKYEHVIGTTSVNDSIVFNKYQYPVQVRIISTGGDISGTWSLSISPNNDDTSVSNNAVYLQLPNGINNSSIKYGEPLLISRNDGWGNEIQENVSSSFTVVLSGSSVSNYYKTVTIAKTILTKPKTLQFIIYINVGSGSQPLSLGNCSLNLID